MAELSSRCYNTEELDALLLQKRGSVAELGESRSSMGGGVPSGNPWAEEINSSSGGSPSAQQAPVANSDPWDAPAVCILRLFLSIACGLCGAVTWVLLTLSPGLSIAEALMV